MAICINRVCQDFEGTHELKLNLELVKAVYSLLC